MPDSDYTFTQLIRARAAADQQALVQHGRRPLRANQPAGASRGILALAGALGG